ncbi:glycoside hydrolase family 38 C-terminal domain-containing protein [Pontiella sulfatireligans]|uniref:Glycoside hydrolase family 38 N-terminal domain-containing protein n=1 Tax=Pontiella sulfatireligans TaxID=2750658 RepID=A0A6C2UJE3_9BACT|nr:glycoside hydrolase family 38 C-terminal domain-containing protein [Pontiella sulfatireligans]VGO19531.1 hypothetical protein SCARR_01590 [Pontiella sulfatireligans]
MKKLSLAALLGIAFNLGLFCCNSAAAADQAGSELSSEKAKKVLIFYDSAYPAWGYLPWFLYDPLIRSEVNVEVDKVYAGQGETDPLKYIKAGADLQSDDAGAATTPMLTEQIISSYDLVIVPYPHTIKNEYINDLLNYVDNNGSLLLVQPTFESPTQAARFLSKQGIAFKGIADQTPASSLLTDHPSARILGLPEGSSVYPHRTWLPHVRFDPGQSTVLTQVGLGGDPDLFVSANGRVGLAATDIFSDLDAHVRNAKEYAQYKTNIGHLIVNTFRSLLGMEFFDQPVQAPMRRWSEMFYAYASSRDYVLLAQQEEPFSERLSAEKLMRMLDKADHGIGQAASLLVQGKFDEGKAAYNSSVKLLSECMDQMTSVKRYMIRGWHSSVLTPDYYGGGLLGFAEPEYQDHLMQWMEKQLGWCERTGARRLMNVYPCDLQLLVKYYPDEFKRFRDGIKDGYLESVHGIYSAAFLPILSEESNVRQFAYGLPVFEDTLGKKVQTYATPRDHFDYHPQLPQLLNNFGYKQAILHSGWLGEIKRIRADKIMWRGLDGSDIEACPQYEGIRKPLFLAHPENIAKADKLGYKTILLGDTLDATCPLYPVKIPSEKELTLINPIAPIAGTWVTAKEFFELTPKAEQSVFLGVDDLWACRIDIWSSWGCLNQHAEWNRTTENKILAAEKLSAMAAVLGKMPSTDLMKTKEQLDESWQTLLRTQDHMFYGPVNYANQVPPVSVKPGEEKAGGHAWGYDREILPRSSATPGGMENYTEDLGPNYAGPMIPVNRYNRVKEFIKETQGTADTIASKAFSELSGEVTAPPRDKSSIPLLVFNQLGWDKGNYVEFEKSFSQGEVFHFNLNDGSKEVSYQVVSEDRYADGSVKRVKALFWADIPSLGYKTYYLKPTTEKPAPVVAKSLQTGPAHLENDYYRVEINSENGGISRIFDKTLGKEMLDSNRVGNELFSPCLPAVRSSDESATVEVVEQGPLRSTIRIRSKVGAAPYDCLVRLYDNMKRIDFDLTVDYGKEGMNFGRNGMKFGEIEDRYTGLFVQFPLNFKGKLYINQPFGLYETQKERQVTTDFADVYQGQYGLSLIHRNSPSYRYRNGILSICLTRARPYVVGKQNYQYSIYTHKEDPFQGDAYTVAKSVNTPFIVYWPDTLPVEQQQAFSFLSVNKPNIVLSALYYEGDTTYVRFYERSGKKTKASIHLPYLKSGEYSKVKLNHEKVRELKSRNGKIKLEFEPWEIVTIAISGAL